MPTLTLSRFHRAVVARLLSLVTLLLPGLVAAQEGEEGALVVQDGLLSQVFGRIGTWFDGLLEQARSAGLAIMQIGDLGPWWQSVTNTPGQREAIVLGAVWVIGVLALAWCLEWVVSRLLGRPRRLVQAHAEQSARTTLLRRLPYALLHAFLYWVPVLAFLATTGVMSNAFLVGGRAYFVVLAVANAYAGVRLALAVCRLLASPVSARLRLFAISDEASRQLYRWIRMLAFTSGVGIALGESLLAVGVAPHFQILVMKLTSLVVHIMLIVAVIQTRHTVSAFIRGPEHLTHSQLEWADPVSHGAAVQVQGQGAAVKMPGGAVSASASAIQRPDAPASQQAALTDSFTGTPPAGAAGHHPDSGMTASLLPATVRSHARHARSGWHALRGFVADAWVFLAVAFIAGLWVVWALSVANGFQRVIHFLALTAAVLIAARVVVIVVFGLLDALFSRIDPLLAEGEPAGGQRYRAVVRGFVTILLAIATVVVLLAVWGAPIGAWFAVGTIGRRIASAAWTIGVAILLAILAWEAVGFALQRRMDQWTALGDGARVARLRTLMPILRTAMFVLIGLVVLFTALSELGVNTAPLLASAGLLSAAIAFGSQNLVKDFVTGIFLLMENTMQVGDAVTVAGVSGTVEHLSVRTVRLRAGDGSLHTVPFSAVTTVNNTNRGIGNAAVRVSVTADSDVNEVIDTLKQIGAKMRAEPAFESLILADIDIWGVDQIDGSSITLAGQIRTVDRGRWGVQREFNRRVLQAFKARGIRLTNPRETIVMQGMAPAAAGPQASVSTTGA